MSWFEIAVRSVGASCPYAASLVQLHAELDAKTIKDRIAKLEDPTSCLHEDIPELSRRIYARMDEKGRAYLDEEDYAVFERPLALLEGKDYIEGKHAIGRRYARGIRLVDPTFTVYYLCVIADDSDKIERLEEMVDQQPVGKWLDCKDAAKSTDLPFAVVVAFFKICESKGLGIIRGLNNRKYRRKA
jgi:hypothetical protein